MKKYYSVKEAAKLLGVSTNTIYSYLDSGKIIARRIGRGRFKIPYSYLKDYIDPESTDTPIEIPVAVETFPKADISVDITPSEKPIAQVQVVTQQPIAATESAVNSPVPEFNANVEETNILLPQTSNYEKDIVPMVNDKIFWRIFKGVSFLGMGVIYLLSGGFVFQFSGDLFGGISGLLNVMLPYGLIVSGILNLADALIEKKLTYFDPLIHVFNAVTLAYFALLSLATADYGRFVFAGSFAVMVVTHLVKEIKHEGTLFERISRFGAILSVFGGIVLILAPPLFPIPALTTFVQGYQSLFGILWVGLITAPFIYLISDYGRRSTIFASAFYLIVGTITLFIATQMITLNKWDIAYISYLLGIYGIFLAIWKGSHVVLDRKKVIYTSLAFIWVGVAIFVGIFVQQTNSSSYNTEVFNLTKKQFTGSVDGLRSKVDEYRGHLTSFAGNPETVEVVEKGNEDQAIERARLLFDRSDLAVRVLLLNSEGKAVGVYPRQSISQGTNFSSREYYADTKANNKGVVSDVYKNILGNHSVAITEPIFKNNQIIGLAVIALDLEKISDVVKSEMVTGASIHILDSKGNYIIGSDKDLIGKNKTDLEFLKEKTSETISKNILISQSSQNPAWTYYLDIPSVVAFNKGLSSSSIVLTFFILINSILSLFAGIAIATKKKHQENDNNTQNIITRPEVKLEGVLS